MMNTILCHLPKFESFSVYRRWVARPLKTGQIRFYATPTNFHKNLSFILEHLFCRSVCLDTDLNYKISFEENIHNSNKYSEIYKIRSFMFTNGPNQFMKIDQENSNPENYKKKFIIEIKKLNEVPHLTDGEANDLIRVFMSSVGSSFLSYYQWHLDEAESLAQEHQEIIHYARPFIRLYGIKLENFLAGTFEDFDEWDDVCFRRTYIEAFNSMFGKIVSIDVEDIEDYMQQRKGSASLSSSDIIPQNIPKSHWWWN